MRAYLFAWCAVEVSMLALLACSGASSSPAVAKPTSQSQTTAPNIVTSDSPPESATDGVTPVGSLTARVIRIIDGDTIEVAILYDSASAANLLSLDAVETVRFLGIATPETFAQNKPAEYGSINDTGCLDRWGDLATDFAVESLDEKTVDLVLDAAAKLRGSFGRLLAYVQLDDLDFNAPLVELGYARVYEEGSSRREAVYLNLQPKAWAQSIGLWECQGNSMPTSLGTTGNGTEAPDGD